MEQAIDAHVHVWTDDREKYKRVAGEADYSPKTFTPEILLSHAKPAGVARIALVQMSFYGFDNSYMLDCIRNYPGVFSGIAVVDSEAPDLDATMKKLKSQGVRGFRIAPGRNEKTWLEAAGMRAMWKHGAELGMAMCPLVNPSALEGIDQMCSRFPETRVVVDHIARIGADGTIRDADIRQLSRLARHRRVFVKVSAFYALGKKKAPYTDLAPLIRRVMEDFGSRRLMWASDCPFQVEKGHNYADSIALIRERLPFLSDDDKAWILGRTAANVFFDGKKS